MLNKISFFFGGAVLIGALMAMAGLGVWVYELNSQIAQAHSEYSTLEIENSKLKTDYEQLRFEYSKSQVDLETAHTKIDNLQDRLAKAQSEQDSLKTNLAAVKDDVALLYAFEFESEATIDSQVSSSEDSQLKKLWSVYQDTKSRAAIQKLWDYVIQSIAAKVGINLLPQVIYHA